VQDRLNWFQKCCGLYNKFSKDLSNATVHYEEASMHFPREFKGLATGFEVKGQPSADNGS